MLMLERYQKYLRFWAVITLIVFLPSSVEAWNFMPVQSAAEALVVAARELPLDARAERELHRQRVARAVETDGRFRLLDDSVLEDSRSVLPPIDELLPKPERLPDPFTLSRLVVSGELRNPLDDIPNDITLAPDPIPEPIVVAQNVAADNLLAEADEHAAQSRFGDAGLTYLSVMDRHPRTSQSVRAYDKLNALSKRLMKGEVPQTEIQKFLTGLPTWEECNSADSKYILLGFAWSRAEAAKATGDTLGVEAHGRDMIDLAWKFIDEHPNNPLQALAVRHLVEGAYFMGQGELSKTLGDLEFYVQSFPESWATFHAKIVLGHNYTQNRQDWATGLFYYGGARELADRIGMDGVLGDSGVNDSVKAWILKNIGMSHFIHREYFNAYQYFDAAVTNFPNAGVSVHIAGLYRAACAARIAENDPNQGILAYQEFVDLHPETDQAAMALILMARAYAIYGTTSTRKSYSMRSSNASQTVTAPRPRVAHWSTCASISRELSRSPRRATSRTRLWPRPAGRSRCITS